jgi:hypothetical protein
MAERSGFRSLRTRFFNSLTSYYAAKQEARTDGGNFDGIFCRDASRSLKHPKRSAMWVTKGNNFFRQNSTKLHFQSELANRP